MEQPLSDRAGEAAHELRKDAQKIGSSAANRLHTEVDARKGNVAEQIRSVSFAIQHAAGELEERGPAWLNSALQQGADKVQRLADSLQRTDSRELLDQVQTFAREQPGTFLTAFAAAGFAAARVLKAGGEQRASGDVGGASEQTSRSAQRDQATDKQGYGASASFIASGQRNQGMQPGGQSKDEPLVLGTGATSGTGVGGQGEIG